MNAADPELANREDAPNVVAYRVGQLEKAVKDGFAELKQLNTEMVKGFVSQKEMADYKQEAQRAHDDLSLRVSKLETQEARDKSLRDRWTGALDLIKNIAAILVGLGAFIGGLWWVVGLFK